MADVTPQGRPRPVRRRVRPRTAAGWSFAGLGDELRTVVAETMHPAPASLWLREPERAR